MQQEIAALIAERDALMTERDSESRWAAQYLAERDALQAENERLKIELQCVVERMAAIEAHENEEIERLRAEIAEHDRCKINEGITALAAELMLSATVIGGVNVVRIGDLPIIAKRMRGE